MEQWQQFQVMGAMIPLTMTSHAWLAHAGCNKLLS